jgi:hypothetical protein
MAPSRRLRDYINPLLLPDSPLSSLFLIFLNFSPPACFFMIADHTSPPPCMTGSQWICCAMAVISLLPVQSINTCLIRVVYVDAAQVDAVARELKSTVKAMTKFHASGQLLTDHRVQFFDWNVLKGQERLGDISESEWRRAFVGGVLSGRDQIETHWGGF